MSLTEIKMCSKCKKELSLSSFNKDSTTKSGYEYSCRLCRKATVPARIKGTLSYFKKRTWDAINRRTVNGSHPFYEDVNHLFYIKKGIKLEMSKGDFYSFCDKNKERILGYYQKGITPSINRIDSDGHYRVDNLEIISAKINNQLGRDKAWETTRKPVKVTNIKSGEVNYYSSASIAAKKNGFNHSHLTACCRGERNTHRGHTFEYVPK